MNDLRMYILMRTDLVGGNCGKLVAQGSHAANQCIHEARKFVEDQRAAARDFVWNGTQGNPATWQRATMLEADIAEWEAQSGDGFGTCIVLGVDEGQLREKVRLAKARGIHAGITHDPTYPTGMPPKPVSFKVPAALLLSAVAALAAQYPLVALGLASLGTLSWIKDMARFTPPNTLIPVDTCGYVFGRAKDLRDTVGDLSLMR